MVRLQINGVSFDLDVDPATPLLWVIRDAAGLKGTKFGCGIAQCGACTVHLDGNPIRSCVTPAVAAEGREITTIEGVAEDDGGLHPVQQAWIDEQVPQCGYCQSGQIMAATALLETLLAFVVAESPDDVAAAIHAFHDNRRAAGIYHD